MSVMFYWHLFCKGKQKKLYIMKWTSTFYPLSEDLAFFYLDNLEKETKNTNYEFNQVNDGTYILHDAPGYTKKDISVDYENGYLTIEGERTYKLNNEEKTKKFKSKIKIGDVSSELEATIENGILSIFIPNYKKLERRKIKVL